LFTVKISFLARDRDEKLNQKKFTLTVTRQERNFHCKILV